MCLLLNVSVNPSCLGTWQEICQIPGFASQYLSNLSKSGSMANSIKTVWGNFLQYQNKIYFLDIFVENYLYPCLFKLEIITRRLTFGMWKWSGYKTPKTKCPITKSPITKHPKLHITQKQNAQCYKSPKNKTPKLQKKNQDNKKPKFTNVQSYKMPKITKCPKL